MQISLNTSEIASIFSELSIAKPEKIQDIQSAFKRELERDKTEPGEPSFYGNTKQERDYYRAGFEVRSPLSEIKACGEIPLSGFESYKIENAHRAFIKLFDSEVIYSDEFIDRVSELLSLGYTVEMDCGICQDGDIAEDGKCKSDIKLNRLGIFDTSVSSASSLAGKLLPNGFASNTSVRGGIADEVLKKDDLNITADIVIKRPYDLPDCFIGMKDHPHLFVVLRKIEKPAISDASKPLEYEPHIKNYGKSKFSPPDDKNKVDQELEGSKLSRSDLRKTLELFKAGKTVSFVNVTSGLKEPLGVEVKKWYAANKAIVLITPPGDIESKEIYVPLILGLISRGKKVFINRRDPLGQEEINDIMEVSYNTSRRRADILIDFYDDNDYDAIIFSVINELITLDEPVALRFNDGDVPPLDDLWIGRLVDYISEESGIEVKIEREKRSRTKNPCYIVSASKSPASKKKK